MVLVSIVLFSVLGHIGADPRGGQNCTCLGRRCEVSETVLLDPDTASRWLVLSEGERRVRRSNVEQDIPDHFRKFNEACVLGRSGFSTGQHYWEVQLLQEGDGWSLGVASDTASLEEWVIEEPEAGVWVVARWGRKGQYVALTSLQATPLTLHEEPVRLGVHLDYEGGRLSLCNADTMEHLYTFTEAGFTDRVYPYLHLGLFAEMRLD
ncbi:hypothetical protein NDU88_000084 [Pleurodeles waltl]|uniref:B30.2/SPRY domain-containing protein n=2 Tax=Pleurodeles waltl TaxID=8319 RepID=A0AAV7U2J2_PLEWA|nr:hypothetical protein NDU88_000084 [Pleurodeles waltl]